MAGPRTTRPPAGSCGATGWPSSAITVGRWSWNSSPKMRALAALISRSRIRSPARTGEGLGDAAVDRDGVADPAVVARVMQVAEVVADLGVRQQTPVVEHPGHVAVDLDRLALLDDQRPVEAAADLLEAALVRVVPVGAGVGDVELVDEGLARARSAAASDAARRPWRSARARRANARWSPRRAGSRPRCAGARPGAPGSPGPAPCRCRPRRRSRGTARRRGASARDRRPDESRRSGRPGAPRPQYRCGCRGAARGQKRPARKGTLEECSQALHSPLDGDGNAERCSRRRCSCAEQQRTTGRAGCRRSGSGVSQG